MEQISRVQGPRVHASRVQLTSRPESKRREFKRPNVHSPSALALESKRPDFNPPESKRPVDQSPSVQTRRPESSFSGMPYKRYGLIWKFAAKTSCKEFVKVMWK